MTIDLSKLPRCVSLVVGERIMIPLPSYADSGNIWSAMCLGNEEVARVTVKLGNQPPASSGLANGVAEPPSLMLVPEFAVIEGLKCGKTAWRLILARSFGRSNPAATHDLDIAVEQ